MRDLYGGHWSITGRGVPGAPSPDEDVFLPGRNLILGTHAALLCSERGIPTLALATLRGNPFADNRPEFFASLARTVELATGYALRIVRPYAHLSKAEVIRRTAAFPLEESLSCLQPRGDLHCGACNKCAERQAAFHAAGVADRTRYAA
jgi:7-cyano-7-deazaguanine synthase